MRNITTGAVSAGADAAMSKNKPLRPAGNLNYSAEKRNHALALAGGVTLHAVNMYITTTVMPSVIVKSERFLCMDNNLIRGRASILEQL